MKKSNEYENEKQREEKTSVGMSVSNATVDQTWALRVSESHANAMHVNKGEHK